MVTEEELEGFRKDRYFSRSWALLTRQKGWIKPVLVLTVCMLVPVVGWFGVLGYVLEWARLTAWGVNAAPKQRGVRIGECIASGARAFVVMLVWYLVAGVVLAVLSVVPLFEHIIDLLSPLLLVIFSMVVMVAVMRATIYRRIVPGFRAGHVWKMVEHNPGGLARCLGMMFLGSLLMDFLAAVLVGSVMVSVLPVLFYLTQGYSMYLYGARGPLMLVLEALSSLGPMTIVFLLLILLVCVVTTMLGYTAVALWVRQFNVPAWRGDKDPLPDFLSDSRDVASGRGTDAPGAEQSAGAAYSQAAGTGSENATARDPEDDDHALPPSVQSNM